MELPFYIIRLNTVKYGISDFLDFSDQIRILYGIPEAREVSKNLPGARGFVFPKYEPIPSHGDPVCARDYQILPNSCLPDHWFSKLVLIFLFFGGCFEGVRPVSEDAYRLHPSPKGVVWGVYLSSEIDFIRILWDSGGIILTFLEIWCSCVPRQFGEFSDFWLFEIFRSMVLLCPQTVRRIFRFLSF